MARRLQVSVQVLLSQSALCCLDSCRSLSPKASIGGRNDKRLGQRGIPIPPPPLSNPFDRHSRPRMLQSGTCRMDSCLRRNDRTEPYRPPVLSFPRKRESRLQGRHLHTRHKDSQPVIWGITFPLFKVSLVREDAWSFMGGVKLAKTVPTKASHPERTLPDRTPPSPSERPDRNASARDG